MRKHTAHSEQTRELKPRPTSLLHLVSTVLLYTDPILLDFTQPLKSQGIAGAAGRLALWWVSTEGIDVSVCLIHTYVTRVQVSNFRCFIGLAFGFWARKNFVRKKKGKFKVFSYLRADEFPWAIAGPHRAKAEGTFKLWATWLEPYRACPSVKCSIHKCQKKNVHMICVIPKLSIFHISSMTHLHTYCNDRILEWRRNLLLKPWSWNRNLMKLTMQEQGQNAAAGEERERG